MQKYELVLVIDPKKNEEERKKMIEKFEQDFKKNILEKDDMWVQSLEYDFSRVRGRNSAYFISYYLDLEPSDVAKIKELFLYTNGVYRYSMFSMSENEEFWEYKKINKQLSDMIDSWDVKRYGNRVFFYSNPENTKYLTWKAIVMLKKYLTRFGNIKPRAYTKNPVNRQKALRKTIIRARELWLLNYIK